MSLTRLPVSWHLSHSAVLPWHQVTPNGSLVLLRVNHSAQGTYSCYDNSGRLLRSIKLRLGRKCSCDLLSLLLIYGLAPLKRSVLYLVFWHGTAAFKNSVFEGPMYTGPMYTVSLPIPYRS